MEELQQAQEVQLENPIQDVIEEGGVQVDGHQEPVQQEYETQEEYVPPPGFEDIPSESVESETSHVDWESETRKFQSLYDKSEADNYKMQQILRQQVEMQQQQQAGQATGEPELEIPSEEEFSPWDAYYKPGSPSFKFREHQDIERVDTAVQYHMAQMNNQMVMNNTVKELKDNYQMDEGEVREFMNFATAPRGNLSLDTLVKVWSEDNKPPSGSSGIGKVKSNQKAPRSAGVIQGQAPQPQKDDAAKTWDKIMAGGGRFGSKIP
tara:strand:- start:2209 stop:3003 length:795 start_codon:yes stop_codon:yes gene_type:complete